jgi:hypothetical protein
MDGVGETNGWDAGSGSSAPAPRTGQVRGPRSSCENSNVPVGRCRDMSTDTETRNPATNRHYVALRGACDTMRVRSQSPACRRLPGAHAMVEQWARQCTKTGRGGRTNNAFLSATLQQGTDVDNILSSSIEWLGGGLPAAEAVGRAMRGGAAVHTQARCRQRAADAAMAILGALHTCGLAPVDSQVPFPAPTLGVSPVADLLCVDKKGRWHLVEVKFGASGMHARGRHRARYLQQLAVQAYCAKTAGFGHIPVSCCHLVVAAARQNGGGCETRVVGLSHKMFNSIKARLDA